MGQTVWKALGVAMNSCKSIAAVYIAFDIKYVPTKFET